MKSRYAWDFRTVEVDGYGVATQVTNGKQEFFIFDDDELDDERFYTLNKNGVKVFAPCILRENGVVSYDSWTLFALEEGEWVSFDRRDSLPQEFPQYY